jgi:hypothetical protein
VLLLSLRLPNQTNKGKTHKFAQLCVCAVFLLLISKVARHSFDHSSSSNCSSSLLERLLLRMHTASLCVTEPHQTLAAKCPTEGDNITGSRVGRQLAFKLIQLYTDHIIPVKYVSTSQLTVQLSYCVRDRQQLTQCNPHMMSQCCYLTRRTDPAFFLIHMRQR